MNGVERTKAKLEKHARRRAIVNGVPRSEALKTNVAKCEAYDGFRGLRRIALAPICLIKPIAKLPFPLIDVIDIDHAYQPSA